MAIAAVAVASLCSLVLSPAIERVPFALYFIAVIVAARVGGLLAGLLAAGLGLLAADYLIFAPRFELKVASPEELLALLILALAATVVGSITAQLRAATEAERRQRESLATTLRSVGDGVIAADARGQVSLLNPVAEKLTGWTNDEAVGRPIEEVFRIVNEQTRAPVPNPISRVLREGAIVGLANSTVLIARDGTERPIDDSGAPIRDAQGGVVGAVLVFRDISARRATERERESLLERERTARELAEAARAQVSATLESITNAFYAVDREWRFTYVNARAAAFQERRPEEILGKVLWDEFPNVRISPLAPVLHQVMEQQQPARIEYLHPTRGTWREAHVYPNQGGVAVYFQDITPRKKAEEQLARSRELLEESQRSGRIGSWEWDIAANAVTWSDELYRVYGLAPGSVQVTYETFLERVHTDDRDLVQVAIEQAFETRQPFSFDHRIVRPDGSVRVLHARGRVITDEDGVPVRMIGSGQDITERHEAESNLRRQAELLELAHDAIIVLSLENRIQFWSRGAEEMYGWSRDEAVGSAAQELLQTRFPTSFQEVLATALEQGRWEGELHHTTKGGDELVVASRWAFQRDEHGQPTAILEINRDVTSQREVEDQLRENERRLQLALKTARMVAWEWDPVADRITVNGDLREIYGIEAVTEANQGFSLVHPEDVDRHRAAVLGALEAGADYHSEFRVVRPDNGEVVWLEERGQATLDRLGKPIRMTGVVVDITERRRLEQARQDFVSIVAHELRNPLAGIRGYAQLMRRRNSYEERAVSVIIGQVDQLERRLSDLTDLSRLEAGRLSLERQPTDLLELAHASVEQARGQSDAHTISLEGPDYPLVGTWDRDRLGQVLMNLLSNAMKYSPDGGEIVVRVEQSGAEAVVSVSDQGVGIAAEDIPRLFERFYRASGSAGTARGLGLGLYIVKQLVEAHGGRIVAESAGAGRGSRFTVSLPLDGVAPPAGGFD